MVRWLPSSLNKPVIAMSATVMTSEHAKAAPAKMFAQGRGPRRG
jgi:hypothetical protein